MRAPDVWWAREFEAQRRGVLRLCSFDQEGDPSGPPHGGGGRLRGWLRGLTLRLARGPQAPSAG